MAKELKQKRFEFYLILGLTIFAIISCAIASIDGGWTFAWMAYNHNTNVQLTALAVHSLDTVASVKVYPYHALTSTEGTATSGVFTFEKTASTTNSMGRYSILKPEGNGVLLEITLTDYAVGATSLDFAALTDASVYLGELDATTKQLKQPLALTGNSLSSIVCFYAFASTDIVDSGTYYSVTMTNTKNTTGTKMTFVSNDTLVKEVPMCSYIGGTTTLWVVLDYDQTLIEAVYSANIGNSVINDISNMSSDGQSYLDYVDDFSFWVDAVYPNVSSGSTSV
jgi:hypothetical protein